MNIYPSDEAASFQTGDLVFRYVNTGIFWTLLPVEGREDVVEWTAEEVVTTVVAQVNGRYFTARWMMGHKDFALVNQSGRVIQSDIIARQLFPTLGKHVYATTVDQDYEPLSDPSKWTDQ